MPNLDPEVDADQLTIVKTISKIGTTIKEKHKKGEDVNQEIEQLKGKILSKNGFASLVACQTFVKLYDNSVIDVNRVTALLLPMLQNSR